MNKRIPFVSLSLSLVLALILGTDRAARAATITWNGGSAANDFWSTGGVGGNWTGAAAPGAADDVVFSTTDLAANSATINNIVDADRTIDSLRYIPQSATLWHNTQIDSGVTLTIDGSDGTRTLGLGAAVAGAQTSQVTISGDGELLLSVVGGIVRIGESTTGTHSGTLDMSGLATFTAALGTTGAFRIGSPSGSSAAGDNLVKLADDSTITVGTLDVGGTAVNSGTNTLKLGSGTQIINANTITLGTTSGGRASGEISFDTASGTLKIRSAADTINGRADLNVANVSNVTGTIITGLFDVSDHSADLMLDDLIIGQRTGWNAGTLGTTGTFSFDDGTLDVTAISMGKRQNANTANANGVIATLNIGGGIADIGSISMAENSGSAIGTGTATATLNFTGGVITLAGNISQVSTTQATGTLNLDGATLDMSGNNIGGVTAVTNVNLKSGTLQNVGEINNGAAISKTTGGTLILDGTNTHTGTTLVSAGTLLVNGTHTGGGLYTVASGATLGGTGSTTSAVAVSGGGTISPGNSPGTWASGSETWASGSNFLFEIDNAAGPAGTGWDLLNITGSLGFTATINVDVVSQLTGGGDISGDAANFNKYSDYAWLFVDTTALISSYSGPGQFNVDTTLFTNDTSGGIADGYFQVLRGDNPLITGGDSTQLYLYYAAAVPTPEPSTLLLAAIGIAACCAYRRRRRVLRVL